MLSKLLNANNVWRAKVASSIKSETPKQDLKISHFKTKFCSCMHSNTNPYSYCWSHVCWSSFFSGHVLFACFKKVITWWRINGKIHRMDCPELATSEEFVTALLQTVGSCNQEMFVITWSLIGIRDWNQRCAMAWGPFLEGPEKFSHPKNRSKISNITITELFYVQSSY